MKKTALALCAFTVLAGSAHAQMTPATTPINPPASTTTSPTLNPSPTNNPVGPATNINNGDMTQPANSTLRNDVSTSPADPLDPTVDPLDSRGTLETKPTDNVTPLTPRNSSPTSPLPESQSTVNPTNSTLNNSSVRNSNSNINDVSNIETMRNTSPDNYQPALNYDTDNDGMLDTREALRGPVNPEIQPSAPAEPMENSEAMPQP